MEFPKLNDVLAGDHGSILKSICDLIIHDMPDDKYYQIAPNLDSELVPLRELVVWMREDGLTFTQRRLIAAFVTGTSVWETGYAPHTWTEPDSWSDAIWTILGRIQKYVMKNMSNTILLESN